MDTAAVHDLVSKLNYDWFKKKCDFFLKEGFYNKELKRIYDSYSETELIQIGEEEWKEEERNVVVDVDFNKYCWDSFFYGSNSYRLADGENDSKQFPVDSSAVADDIVGFIYKYTEKFTDVDSIDAVIENAVNAVQQAVVDLQKDVTDATYKDVLEDFVIKSRQELSKEFKHIKQQIKLKSKSGSIDKKLTTEICSRIANFRVGSKRLITNVDGDLDEGAALYHLLSPGSKNVSKIKIRIEDWSNIDVYYLLSRLSDIITGKFSIADIQRKKILLLKNGKLFTRSTYDNFKSQKLDAYIVTNSNKSAIDSQLTTLFNR